MQHIKAYVFDDTLLLSGANLSNAYFSNRQDRYLRVRGQPHLAAFVRQAVQTVSRLSYKLLPAVGGGAGEAVRSSGAGAADVGPCSGSREPVGEPAGEAAASSGIPGRLFLGPKGSALEGSHRPAPAAGCSSVPVSPGASAAAATAPSDGRHPAGAAVPPLRRRDRVAALLRHVKLLSGISTQHSALNYGALISSAAALGGRWGGASAGPDTQQGFRLATPPLGVDPVRHAWLFGRTLREGLLQIFVPPGGETGVVDFGVLAAEQGDGAHPAVAQEAGRGTGQGGSWAAHAHSSGGNGEGRVSSGSSREGLPSSVGWEQPWPHPPARDPASSGPAAAGGQGPDPDPAGDAAAGGTAVSDTWVLPLAQAGFAGLRQEERCTLGLLRWAAEASAAGGGGGVLQVSTPYLNLARPYEWMLAQVRRGCI